MSKITAPWDLDDNYVWDDPEYQRQQARPSLNVSTGWNTTPSTTRFSPQSASYSAHSSIGSNITRCTQCAQHLIAGGPTGSITTSTPSVLDHKDSRRCSHGLKRLRKHKSCGSTYVAKGTPSLHSWSPNTALSPAESDVLWMLPVAYTSHSAYEPPNDAALNNQAHQEPDLEASKHVKRKFSIQEHFREIITNSKANIKQIWSGDEDSDPWKYSSYRY